MSSFDELTKDVEDINKKLDEKSSISLSENYNSFFLAIYEGNLREESLHEKILKCLFLDKNIGDMIINALINKQRQFLFFSGFKYHRK